MKPLLVVLLLMATVHAAPARRFALIVGANRGDADDQPLRYAEADAERLTRVLRELGGFRKEDIVELKTPDGAALERALGELTARIGAENGAGRPPLVLFYYSGHADAEALHTNGTHVGIERLRQWLRASKAAVRVAVLDSCRSGALTRVKGMHAAPAIELNLANDITTRGEALLTSSTADELARESDALRGSFFTHHLVSGLRGAADQSKDGRVTLAEAYDYAYAKTVTQAEGGQHPTFKYDLAGRGDVVLTALADAGAWLDFSAESSGTYLILSEDGLLLGDVEVGKAPLKIAVAPGRYEIRKGTPRGQIAVRIVLGQGEERWIHDEEMQPVATSWYGPAKGYETPPQEEAPPPQPAPLPRLNLPPVGDLLPYAVDLDLVGHERDRARKLRQTGISLIVSGVVGLLPTFGLVAYSVQELRRDPCCGAGDGQFATYFPAAAGLLVGSATLIAGGSALYRNSNQDLRRLRHPELIDVDGLSAGIALRNQRQTERARILIWTGAASAAAGMALAISSLAVSNSTVTRTALVSSGLSAMALGGASVVLGTAIRAKLQADSVSPAVNLGLAPMRGGALMALGGTL